MKKSLTINATRAGKKVSKNIGYVNPDVANSFVGGFAQMVNALSTDTFVNAEVVKKMDTNEQEQQSGGGTTKLEPTLTVNAQYAYYTYNGDGEVFAYGYDSDGNPLYLAVDRQAKRIYKSGGDNDGTTYYYFLHATEGEKYAAKTASDYYTYD